MPNHQLSIHRQDASIVVIPTIVPTKDLEDWDQTEVADSLRSLSADDVLSLRPEQLNGVTIESLHVDVPDDVIVAVFERMYPAFLWGLFDQLDAECLAIFPADRIADLQFDQVHSNWNALSVDARLSAFRKWPELNYNVLPLTADQLAERIETLSATDLTSTDWNQWTKVDADMFTNLLIRLGSSAIAMLGTDDTQGRAFLLNWAKAVDLSDLALTIDYLPVWAFNAVFATLTPQQRSTIFAEMGKDNLADICGKLSPTQIAEIPPGRLVDDVNESDVRSRFSEMTVPQRLELFNRRLSICPGAWFDNSANRWRAYLPLSPAEVAVNVRTLSFSELSATNWTQFKTVQPHDFTFILLKFTTQCVGLIGDLKDEGAQFITGWALSSHVTSSVVARVKNFLPAWCMSFVPTTKGGTMVVNTESQAPPLRFFGRR